MPLSSITKPEDMNLTAISALVFVLVAIKTLVNAIQERKRQEKANRDFCTPGLPDVQLAQRSDMA